MDKDTSLSDQLDALRAELAQQKANAEASAAKLASLSDLVIILLKPPEKSAGVVVALKTAAFDCGYSTETVRRLALADPAVGAKRGGQWQINPVALQARLAAKRA
jgi:hypothetical protein